MVNEGIEDEKPDYWEDQVLLLVEDTHVWH